jgi:hypothetical protein
MPSYGTIEDRRVKHLEMIQAVIGRLGNDSFLVKGWAVTIVGAFLGFAVSAKNCHLAIAGVIPALLFWGLDAHFLRSERLFRALYDGVRSRRQDIDPFYMAATSHDFVSSLPPQHASSWWSTLWRPTLAIFYGALLASAVAVVLSLWLR